MPRVRAGVRCVSSVGVSSTAAAAPPVPSDDELTAATAGEPLAARFSCIVNCVREI